MASETQEKNRDDEAPIEKKLDDLYALLDGMEIAMMTTRRRDGHLVSRAMATQERRAQAAQGERPGARSSPARRAAPRAPRNAPADRS